MKKTILFSLFMLALLGLFGCSNNRLVKESNFEKVESQEQCQALFSDYNHTVQKTTIADQQATGYLTNISFKLNADTNTFKGKVNISLSTLLDSAKNTKNTTTANGNLTLLQNKALNLNVKSVIYANQLNSFNDVQYSINVGSKDIKYNSKFKDKANLVITSELKKLVPTFPIVSDIDLFILKNEYVEIYQDKKDTNNILFKVKLAEYLKNESKDIKSIFKDLSIIGFPEIKEISCNNNDHLLMSFKKVNDHLLFKGIDYKINLNLTTNSSETMTFSLDVLIKETNQKVSMPSVQAQSLYNGQEPENVFEEVLRALVG